jgi:malonyl-ACP decarboxylase
MLAKEMNRIAITGTGVVCTIGQGMAELAAALQQGRCGITSATGELGARLDRFSWRECLDQLRLAAAIRSQAVKLLSRAPLTVQVTVCAALQAWLAAGLPWEGESLERTGVILGGSNLANHFTAEQLATYGKSPENLHPRYGFAFFDSYAVGILSQLTGIRGVGYTVGGASASGNLAVIEGSRLISDGSLDACLAVGGMTDLSPIETHGLKLIGAMHPGTDAVSPHAGCWPFDRSARGFVPGQGAAAVVMENLERSTQRRAPVLGELAGGGQALGGTAGPEPSASGEARAMSLALKEAGWAPDEVDYLNAHGTATPSGDDTECKAIHTVFGDHVNKLWINATKGLTGHCICAAGTVELVAVLAQMREGFLHPNLHLTNPIDDRLRFVGARSEERPIRRALSNSFGFSGINTCLAIRVENS